MKLAKWLIKFRIRALLLIVIGFVFGILFGYSYSQTRYWFSEGLSRGDLAAVYLSQLENGNTALLKYNLENDVDVGLATYSTASEQWWFPLYRSGLLLVDPDKLDKFLRRIATYRKHHPINKSKERQKTSENKKLRDFERDFQRRVNEMAEKYGDK